MHYSTTEATMGLNHDPGRSVVVYAATCARKRGQPLTVISGLTVELNLLCRKSRAAGAGRLGRIPKLKGLTAAQAGHQI